VDDVVWKLEPATAAKHRLYRRYLAAWWAKLLQPNAKGYKQPRVTYVDAFAGPGLYLGGQEGSPLFVLDELLNHAAIDRMDLRRERVTLIFIERERARFEYLRDALHQKFGPLNALPVTVDIRLGDAATMTTQTLDESRAWGFPMLAVFDSWGNVAIPLRVVQRIAHSKSGEALVTFGPNWFSRWQAEDPEQLDLVFGGRQYWQPADQETRPDERWRAWLETYRSALKRAGFPYVLDFELVTKTGLPLHLVHGTGHTAGVDVMKDAMWNVDKSDGLHFRDPRSRGGVPPDQTSLFDDTDVLDPELRELVLQRLQDGPTTIEALGDWLLLETSRWRRTHGLQAAQSLVQEGRVVVHPTGRITRKSVISAKT